MIPFPIASLPRPEKIPGPLSRRWYINAKEFLAAAMQGELPEKGSSPCMAAARRSSGSNW